MRIDEDLVKLKNIDLNLFVNLKSLVSGDQWSSVFGSLYKFVALPFYVSFLSISVCGNLNIVFKIQHKPRLSHLIYSFNGCDDVIFSYSAKIMKYNIDSWKNPFLHVCIFCKFKSCPKILDQVE